MLTAAPTPRPGPAATPPVPSEACAPANISGWDELVPGSSEARGDVRKRVTDATCPLPDAVGGGAVWRLRHRLSLFRRVRKLLHDERSRGIPCPLTSLSLSGGQLPCGRGAGGASDGEADDVSFTPGSVAASCFPVF